jgi:hypothetical protein
MIAALCPSKISPKPKRSSSAAIGSTAMGVINALPIFCKKLSILSSPLHRLPLFYPKLSNAMVSIGRNVHPRTVPYNKLK